MSTVAQHRAYIKRWRAVLLSLCALGVVLTALDLYMGLAGKYSYPGIRLSSDNEPYLQSVAGLRGGGPAARAGLRRGDTLDLRPMSAADRYRLYSQQYAGEPIAVYVVHASRIAKAVVRTASNVHFSWDVWLGFLGGLWMLAFAAILAYRRPDNRDVRTLAMLLIGLSLWQILENNDWITPWAGLDAFVQICASLCIVSFALLATYSNSFAQPASALRRVLLRCSYGVAAAVACFGILAVAVEWTDAFDPSVFATPWAIFVDLSVAFIAPLMCGVAAALQTRQAERTKFLWAFVPLALLYAAGIVNGAGQAFTGFGSTTNVFFNIAQILAPLGLTYSLLNRRLLDVGFALNRAAIFSGVSIVLVGTFVLVEWLISDWMRQESHSANIAVSGALALALGLSIRAVHGKVEHFVDNVMFRKRREDVEAIRKMAREAPYITDQTTLLARAKDVLERHGDAAAVQFLLADERGHYGAIDENDPVLVALRAEHVPVDLHAANTVISGEWAYPMVARGRLVGALVLGPKRSQESYAPDESAAVAQLAHSLASTLDVLSLKREGSQDGVLDAVRSLGDQLLRALPDAIAARMRDSDVPL